MLPSAPRPSPLWRGLQALTHCLPAACHICGHWPGRPICGNCRRELGPPARRCAGCALRLHLPGADGRSPHIGCSPVSDLCLNCSLDAPLWSHAVAAVDYAYPWDSLIGRLKFGSDAGLAGPLAELLLRNRRLRDELQAGALMVPVPLSPVRLAQRGYNQATLIARHLCRATSGRLHDDLLVRVRHTDAQSGLSLDQRRHNLKRAFVWLGVAQPGQRVVLLDDVMTSGETLRACTQTLKAAGIDAVSVAVVARTPHLYATA